MAIEFAASRFIQRSKGHNAVEVAAYNVRERLYCERTGERTPTLDPRTISTHVYHEIMLPAAANTRFSEAGSLWNAVQAAEHRKDSQEAFEIVLPLPADPEITREDRIELARAFARENFSSRGLAVQLDVHTPHSANRDSQVTNHHAHLLATTRRIEGDRLAERKATELFPKVRSLSFGKPIVAEKDLWGVKWRDFQNNWFAANGKAITVDPIAPVPQEHIGPIRFRHPHDHRLATNEHAQQQNAAIARDPQAVADHLGQRPFDERALGRFLSKHIADPEERAEVQVAVAAALQEMKREALEKASWADKVQSGLRPLMIEDLARMLDPEYAALIKRAAELREQAAKEERSRNAMDLNKLAAAYRVAERRIEMGAVRLAAHWIGTVVPAVSILRDLELHRWERMQGGAAYLEDNKGIKKGAAEGELAQVTRLAAQMLDPDHPLGQKLRPSGLTLRQEAERDLQQRQKQARNARATLDMMERSDKINLRERRSLSRGPRL